MSEIIRKILATGLLLLFAAFVAGNTLCVHSHIDDDGKTVVHSHPFRAAANHTHSAAQFNALAIVNSLIYSESSGCNSVDFTYPLVEVATLLEPVDSFWNSFDYAASSLRGPPMVA